MSLGRFIKTPTERKRYVIDYTDWLDTAETVTGNTVSISPSGSGTDLIVDAQSISTDGKKIIIFVNNGADGTTYKLEVRATTSTGQIKEDQVLFVVREP